MTQNRAGRVSLTSAGVSPSLYSLSVQGLRSQQFVGIETLMTDVPPSPASAATAPEARTFSVGLMITRARRLIWSTANRRLQPLGETILEWPIYSHIACLGPSSQRDMAAAIAQDPASV
jgi:hypothetical protein